MKIRNYLLLVVCLFSFQFIANAETNLMFEKANQLYHNKMYDSASKLYLQMINDGYENTDLYYNAGNALYKNNQIGMAIWCFKKALQSSDHVFIQDNLALAQQKIIEPIYAPKEIFFMRWWHAMYNLCSVNTWAILALLFFIISVVLLFIKKLKPLFFISQKITSLLFVFSLICLFFLLVKWNQDTYHYKGIIVSKSQLSEGIEVEYAGQAKTGINVILPDGKKVTISSTSFKKL